MKTILSSQTLDIPEGVKIQVNAKIIKVTGPRGSLTHDFKHLNLDFQLYEEEGQRKLRVEAWFGKRKTMAAIRTAISHAIRTAILHNQDLNKWNFNLRKRRC